jgi:branched-subunit amino acid ABC-type transport system permease component
MTAAQVLQFVFSGLTLGCIYALVALGFTIIFNTTGIVNFAQGDFVMLGAILSASLSSTFGLPGSDPLAARGPQPVHTRDDDDGGVHCPQCHRATHLGR